MHPPRGEAKILNRKQFCAVLGLLLCAVCARVATWKYNNKPCGFWRSMTRFGR